MGTASNVNLQLVSRGVEPARIARTCGSVPATGRPGSLYIHIPFCYHKCHYCDFYSLVDTQDRQGRFTERLVSELTALAEYGSPLRTIFVGGGTPTLLAPAHWRRILSVIASRFEREKACEFTVEANPETVTEEVMETLVDGGVNRISMGVQSFDRRHLKTLERWHDPESVQRASETIRAAGISRLSADLIFGIPGQSVAEWDADLERALSLGTEHLSCYGLTYEPGTAMTARLEAGLITRTEEEIETAMFLHTRTRLGTAGLLPYEISNFARPGAECRHNLVYWRNESWLAAGPSASAHVAGCRWKNVPHLAKYLESGAGLSSAQDFEEADSVRALVETLLMGLRLAEGVCDRRIKSMADDVGPSQWSRILADAESAERRGLLARQRGRWTLTEAGVLRSDSVIAELATNVGDEESGRGLETGRQIRRRDS